MATKTKRPPAASDEWVELDDMQKQIALGNLLEYFEERFTEICDADSVTDAELRNALESFWMLGRQSQQPPAVASAATHVPLVWFGQTHTRSTPSLSGDELLDQVRSILGLPRPADPPLAVPPSGDSSNPARSGGRKSPGNSKDKKPAKSGTTNASPSDILGGLEVIAEEDLFLHEIHPSNANPRQAFDQKLIAEMATQIETICRLNPVTVREAVKDPHLASASHELIDGETRFRAAQLGKAQRIRAKVIRCTDAQAACLRLLSAVQRRDLNPIERAASIKALQEQHGFSQRQVSDLVKLEQGSISNLTRLLDLPEFWKSKVISGEITATMARELVPWLDEPEVIATIEKEWTDCKDEDRSASVFAGIIEDAMIDRSMRIPTGMKFTDAQAAELRIRELKMPWGQKEKRVFNTELLEKLVEEKEAKRKQRDQKRLDSSHSAAPAVDPEKAKENARKQAEQLGRRLYRFKMCWLQAMCRREIGEQPAKHVPLLLFISSTGNHSRHRKDFLAGSFGQKAGHGRDRTKLLKALLDDDSFETTMDQLLDYELQAPFDGYHNVLDPEDIEALAEALGVDIKTDWTASFDDDAPCADLWDDFCGLWSKDQLLDLLDEWKIKRPEKAERMKRDDLQKLLDASKGCPKAIVIQKPVRLN